MASKCRIRGRVLGEIGQRLHVVGKACLAAVERLEERAFPGEDISPGRGLGVGHVDQHLPEGFAERRFVPLVEERVAGCLARREQGECGRDEHDHGHDHEGEDLGPKRHRAS